MYSGNNRTFERKLEDYRDVLRKFNSYALDGTIPKSEYETFFSMMDDISDDNNPEYFKEKLSDLLRNHKIVLSISERITKPSSERKKKPDTSFGWSDPGGN